MGTASMMGSHTADGKADSMLTSMTTQMTAMHDERGLIGDTQVMAK